MTIIMKKPLLSAAVLLLAAALCIVSLASDFRSMQEREPIYPGPGVTSVRMLSDWFPGIHGTPGDTEVYILEGKKPVSRQAIFFIVCIAICIVVAVCFALAPQA